MNLARLLALLQSLFGKKSPEVKFELEAFVTILEKLATLTATQKDDEIVRRIRQALRIFLMIEVPTKPDSSPK